MVSHEFGKKAPPTITSNEIRNVREELNTAVESKTNKSEGRGQYSSKNVTPEDKFKVAKYASKNSVSAAIRHFKRTVTFTGLKENTVSGWKHAYCSKIEFARKRGADLEPIKVLPEKRRGRPLLFNEELEEKVIQKWFLTELRKSGGVVNSQIAMETAKGVVKARDANLLVENGGSININKDWVHRLLGRMGLVKRQATTKAKVSPKDFEGIKAQYLADIRSLVMMEDIPDDLIINWDQTGIKYVPVSNWTMEVKGAKRVEVVGVDDKRQITILLSCTLSGSCCLCRWSTMGKHLLACLRYLFQLIGTSLSILLTGPTKKP